MTRTHPPTHTVQTVTHADLADCCLAMGRAFYDEVGIRWVCPDDHARRRVARVMYSALARSGLAGGARITRVAGRGAFACWHPWGMAMPSTLQMIRHGMFGLARHGLGVVRRAIEFGDALHAMRERAAPKPHVYLAQLGVDPGEQGNGLGGVLLDEGLAWAFERGMPAYLDTTNPGARRLYERKGFRVVDEAPLGTAGLASVGMLALPPV